MRALCCLTALILVGCASSTAERTLATCELYASTLTVLATLKAQGSLSEGQIATVDSVRAVSNPICDGTVRDIEGTLTLLETGLTRLLIVQQTAGQ